jgi:predicted transcriptional regulator
MKDQILLLRSLGYSYKEIKNELGCSLSTISYHCGAEQKDKNLVRLRDRRNKKRKYIQECKQSKPCADCGENYPYYVMQFDHLGDKDFTISKMVQSDMQLSVIKEEIEKCEVVCANCHAVRTHFRSLKTMGDAPDISRFYS